MENQVIHALISTEEYRESPDFMNVNLSDFALFLAVMKHKEAQECVLSIILDEPMKIFLNMSSKNERDELVSLLQYMKNSTLSNPEIIILDERIRRLDAIVTEVKQSEEWEDAQMSILSTGIDIGRRVGHEEGLEEGRKEGQLEGIHAIITVLKEHNLTDSAIIQQLCNSFHLDTDTAQRMFHDFSCHD